MSTWGAKPFQNDSAADFLHEFIQSLAQRITTALSAEKPRIEDLHVARSATELLFHVCNEFAPYAVKPETILRWRKNSRRTIQELERCKQLRDIDRETAVQLGESIEKLVKMLQIHGA